MVLLSQLYAVASAIDSSIPELGGASLGALTNRPIEELDRKISYGPTARLLGRDSATINSLMQFPRQLVANSNSRLAYGGHRTSLRIPGGHSPYGFQNLTLESQPGTPRIQGAFGMVPSQSVEDLSVSSSPYGRNFSNPPSRRQSPLIESSFRHDTAALDPGSPSTFNFSAGSPSFSPDFYGADRTFALGESSSGYTGGFVAPSIWT